MSDQRMMGCCAQQILDELLNRARELKTKLHEIEAEMQRVHMTFRAEVPGCNLQPRVKRSKKKHKVEGFYWGVPGTHPGRVKWLYRFSHDLIVMHTSHLKYRETFDRYEERRANLSGKRNALSRAMKVLKANVRQYAQYAASPAWAYVGPPLGMGDLDLVTGIVGMVTLAGRIETKIFRLVDEAQERISPMTIVPFIVHSNLSVLPYVYWGIMRKSRAATRYESISGEPTERKLRTYLVSERYRKAILSFKVPVRKLRALRDRVTRNLTNIRRALRARRLSSSQNSTKRPLGQWCDDPPTAKQIARLLVWDIPVWDGITKFQAKLLIFGEMRKRYPRGDPRPQVPDDVVADFSVNGELALGREADPGPASRPQS